MNLRSTPPWLNASRESDNATDATSGKIESARMRSTVGQMNSHRAAPSERHAPSVPVARRVARTRRADPDGIGSGGSRSSELSLDAETGDIGSELLVLSGLVGDRVPTLGDGLLGAGGIEFLGKVLRAGGVQHVLLVPLGQRDPQVQHHVLVLEARLDRAEVVLGRGLAQARLDPGIDVGEVGRPVRVVARLAER